MPASIEDVLKDYVYDPSRVERVQSAKRTRPIAIEEPNPEWPKRFEEVKQRIQTALGSFVISIAHVGSTSVPDLPAKDVIDVDLTVKDPTDEAFYVEPMARAGFDLLIREPGWHQHRFFHENLDIPYFVNIHVWGPDCPEAERHRIFREWLLKTPSDLQIYAEVKRGAAEASTSAGEGVMAYNLRKEETIQEILRRAFRDLGYIK